MALPPPSPSTPLTTKSAAPTPPTAPLGARQQDAATTTRKYSFLPGPLPSTPGGPGPVTLPIPTPSTNPAAATATVSGSNAPHVQAAPFPGQVNAVAGPSTSPLSRESQARKRKWDAQGYAEDEQAHMEARSTELHLSLLLDQEETLNASATAFASYEDMVDRLLPWHVWQIHDEELEGSYVKAGGKEGMQAAKTRDTSEAAQLIGRIKKVKERFNQVRRREADTAVRPHDVVSVIKLLKDSTSIASASLQDAKYKAEPFERAWRAHQTRQREIEVERKRQEDIKERQRRLAEEQQRRAREQAAAEIRLQNERKAAAAAKAATAAATKAAADAKAKAAASAAAAATGASNHAGQSERGRGRGRPRGRGRGGMRETMLKHQSAPYGSGGVPAAIAPASPSPARNGTGPTKPAAGSTPAKTPGPAGRSTPAPSLSAPNTAAAVPAAGLASASASASAPGTPSSKPASETGREPPLDTITVNVKVHFLASIAAAKVFPPPAGLEGDSSSAPTPTPSAPEPGVFYPGVFRGPVPVPKDQNAEVQFTVTLSRCTPPQLQVMANALNITLPPLSKDR